MAFASFNFHILTGQFKAFNFGKVRYRFTLGIKAKAAFALPCGADADI